MQTRYSSIRHSTIWTALYWTGDCNEGCFLKTHVSPTIKLNSLAEVAPGGPERRGWKKLYPPHE